MTDLIKDVSVDSKAQAALKASPSEKSHWKEHAALAAKVGALALSVLAGILILFAGFALPAFAPMSVFGGSLVAMYGANIGLSILGGGLLGLGVAGLTREAITHLQSPYETYSF